MVQTKMMTNLDIYNIANALLENFKDFNVSLPVKVNFYFQKNMQTLVTMAQEIDKERLAIFDKYGTRSEDGQYQFDPENTATINAALNDLFSLEQEVKVNLIELDWFANIELTGAQVAALAYMIKEEDE